jgi:hypothetical protein
MRRALFVISVFQFSRETFPVLERCASAGFDVHVLVGWTGETAAAYIEQCTRAGFTVHRPPDELRYGDPRTDAAPPDVEDEIAVAEPPGQQDPARRFKVPMTVFRRTKRYGRDLVAELRPDVVFGGPYFSCGTFDQAIARALRRRSVPYYCLAVSPYLGERNAVEARFSFLANGMINERWLVAHDRFTRLVARLAPNWRRERNGIGLFPWSPKSMIAARLTGLLDPNPWQQPSDLYDVCFVESDFSRRLLVESGYPDRKIVVAGKPLLDDVIARAHDPGYAAAIHEYLRLPAGSQFVLCNVEPGYEHRYRTWDEHWSTFHTVMRGLARIADDVVLSLHPLCDPANYRFVEEQYGFRLAEDYKIVELYPFCGVSVSFPCSTNLLAQVFNKPLVIYDFLGETRECAPRASQYRLPGSRCAYNEDEITAAVTEARAEPFGAPVAWNDRKPASDKIVEEVLARFEHV